MRIAATQVLAACQSTIGKSADKLMQWQRNLVGALVGFTVLLILLNVVTRALNVALFWVDELAIYSTCARDQGDLSVQRKHR